MASTRSTKPRHFAAFPWMLACVSVMQGCLFLPSDERPITGGKPYSDPELAQLLTPDRPVDRTGLSTDARGYRVYEALLQDAPSADYAKHYLDLIRARGVLILPIGSSPHAIPPRVFGYSIISILLARKNPFTIRHAEFSTKDSEWLDKHPLFSAPDPVVVKGRSLTVRIGWERQAWTERVLVPDSDVENVKEFPFRRYPGAVLKSLGHLDDDGLLTRQYIRRFHVVTDTSIREIGRHYEAELRKLGIEDARGAADGLRWHGTPKAGIEAVGISGEPFETIHGSGLNLPELRAHLPIVFEGFPADVREFSVDVHFASPEVRLRYLSRAQQERYKALTQAAAR